MRLSWGNPRLELRELNEWENRVGLTLRLKSGNKNSPILAQSFPNLFSWQKGPFQILSHTHTHQTKLHWFEKGDGSRNSKILGVTFKEGPPYPRSHGVCNGIYLSKTSLWPKASSHYGRYECAVVGHWWFCESGEKRCRSLQHKSMLQLAADHSPYP